MKFSFDPEQLAMRDAVRDVLAKECPPAAVRDPDPSAWESLQELGALSVLVPEAGGGMGLDERWLVLVLEEAGYAGLPQPIVETAAVGLPLVAGEIGASATVASDLGGPIVPWAAEADHLLLADGDEGLVLVARSDVELEPVSTVDHGRHASRVRRPDGVGIPVAGRQQAFDRGAWATAAFLVGLGQRMLDMTVEYVVQREQYGVPIGSFQAIKHKLADAAKVLAFARPTVYGAAWSLATGDANAQRAVSTAKAIASDAALAVGRTALQCHGGIGYTTEADLHLFQKRSWALARTWGDPAWHRDRLGHALGI